MVATLDTEFDEDQAIRVITALVCGNGRKPGMINLFSSYPEYRVEDLVAEGMVGVLRDWDEYTPEKGAKSTFTQQRAYTSIINLQRGAQSGKKKIKRLKARLVEQFHVDEKDEADEAEEKPLAEWLVGVQADSRKQFGGKLYRRGRKFYNMPQLIALAALMAKFDLSGRKCVKMLADRPDLCEALKLRRIPSQQSLWRAMLALVAFRNEQAEKRSKVGDVGTDEDV